MLKLRRRAMRHFVTLIEIHVHLIRVNPGHIWLRSQEIVFVFVFVKHPNRKWSSES